MTNAEKLTLAKHACHIRMGVIEGTHSAKCGHPGGSLDIAEVLSYLYFVEMNVDPKAPKDPDRDRLVLSKGHAAPGLYAALAERGFFPVEDLKTLRKIGSYLQGHPNMNSVPGVDMSTGSLGQGISAAAGMALGAKHAGKALNVYAIVGDGEVEEGECWEAFMFAAHYGLSNLCVFLDRNRLQIDGPTENVMSSEPPSADNPLLRQPNAYITPHIAWATREARTRLVRTAIDNLRAFADGNPVNVVNL